MQIRMYASSANVVYLLVDITYKGNWVVQRQGHWLNGCVKP